MANKSSDIADRRQVNFYISNEAYKKIRLLVQVSGTTFSDFIRGLCEDFIEQNAEILKQLESTRTTLKNTIKG